MRLTLEGSVGTPEPGHAKDAGEGRSPGLVGQGRFWISLPLREEARG